MQLSKFVCWLYLPAFTGVPHIFTETSPGVVINASPRSPAQTSTVSQGGDSAATHTFERILLQKRETRYLALLFSLLANTAALFGMCVRLLYTHTHLLTHTHTHVNAKTHWLTETGYVLAAGFSSSAFGDFSGSTTDGPWLNLLPPWHYSSRLLLVHATTTIYTDLPWQLLF